MDLSSKQAKPKLKKLRSDWIRALQTTQKTTTLKNKRAGWKMASEKSVKRLHSEERKEPYNTLNRTTNIVQELSEKWPQKRKGEKRNTRTRRSPIKVVKTNKTKTVTKDTQPGESRLQQSP